MKKVDHSNLDGRLLELFLAIYDSSSVSTAADQFDLTQSTVSHSLGKLRSCLGDPLFVKSGRGIVPTERATALAPRIRALLADLEGLTEAHAYNPAADSRPISVAANVLEVMPLLLRMRKETYRQAPSAALRLLELGSRDNIETMLETRQVDLVISARPLQIPRCLNSCELFAVERVCYYDASVRGPVQSVSDYCAAGHAALDFGRDKKSVVDIVLDKMSLARSIMLCSPDAESLGQLVAGTDLIMTMQKHLHATSLRHLAFCPPPFAVPKLNFDLIWHRRSEQSGRNTWLRNVVKSVAMTLDSD